MTTAPPDDRVTVVLDDDGISIDGLCHVADGAALAVGPGARAAVEAARRTVDATLRSGTLVYGLNTHLGHARDTPVSEEGLLGWQVEMLRAHHGGFGEPLVGREVRAIMAARAIGIAAGGCGAHPDVLDLLVGMLARDVTPVVPTVGSIGASDLMHLAAVGIVMIGEGRAIVAGQELPGLVALHRVGLEPITLRPKDGLAVISANAYSAGVGALTTAEARSLAEAADLVAACTCEALGANLSPFEAAAAGAKPLAGQIASAAAVRRALVGSWLTGSAHHPSVQDPLSIRCVPQVHGGLRDSVDACAHAVMAELNGRADNPLVDGDRLLSTGNFHPMAIALAFEQVRVAIAHVALISERRTAKLAGHLFELCIDGTSHDELPLPGLLSYAAAAVTAELRTLANAVTLGCPPLDLDVEDHATLAPLAVQTTQRALSKLRQVLAVELALGVQLTALRRIANPAIPGAVGEGTAALATAASEHVNACGADGSALVRGLTDLLDRPLDPQGATP